MSLRIPPPHLMSEAVIQAAFFHHCQMLGINCTLEASTPTGRHDVVVFDDSWKLATAIVECKKSANPACSPRRGERQIERYKLTGVPVHKLWCIHEAEGLAKQIKESKFPGIEWEKIQSMPRKEWRKRKPRFSAMNLCEELNYRQ